MCETLQDSENPSPKVGAPLRLVANPSRVGVFTGKTKKRADRTLYQISFPETVQFVPCDQLELVEGAFDDAIELLQQSKLGRVADLRQNLTFFRLSGRLANVIYSMDTTNTDFYAYQFKPVLKFLDSPGKGILIADEVGLGKTIEAGLIWTELRSRFDSRRLLVICPAILREKWECELENRFGIEAEVVSAETLVPKLKAVAAGDHQKRFALIASFQGLRPPKGWKNEKENDNHNSRSALAQFLDQIEGEEPVLDLLIVDEAHYMRNPETGTAALGRLLRCVSDHVVLLSATPIHLQNQDLYQLLNLVDENSFDKLPAFDAVLEANAPIIKVRDAVMHTAINQTEFLSHLRKACEHPTLAGNRQLNALLENPPSDNQLLDGRFRNELAYKLERINLLDQVVTRTRKREVTEWQVRREAVSGNGQV